MRVEAQVEKVTYSRRDNNGNNAYQIECTIANKIFHIIGHAVNLKQVRVVHFPEPG